MTFGGGVQAEDPGNGELNVRLTFQPYSALFPFSSLSKFSLFSLCDNTILSLSFRTITEVSSFRFHSLRPVGPRLRRAYIRSKREMLSKIADLLPTRSWGCERRGRLRTTIARGRFRNNLPHSALMQMSKTGSKYIRIPDRCSADSRTRSVFSTLGRVPCSTFTSVSTEKATPGFIRSTQHYLLRRREDVQAGIASVSSHVSAPPVYTAGGHIT
jgi:hypothetical protein